MLEHRVDVPLVRRHAGDRQAGEEDLALGRLLEAGDHPERRRLAAARRAEKAGEGAARDLEGHPVDGDDRRRSAWSRRASRRRATGSARRDAAAVARPAGAAAAAVADRRGSRERTRAPLCAAGWVRQPVDGVAMLQGGPMVSGADPQRQRRKRTRFESESTAWRAASRSRPEAILQPRWCPRRDVRRVAGPMAATELQLGPRIRSLRQSRQMTLRELAEPPA